MRETILNDSSIKAKRKKMMMAMYSHQRHPLVQRRCAPTNSYTMQEATPSISKSNDS